MENYSGFSRRQVLKISTMTAAGAGLAGVLAACGQDASTSARAGSAAAASGKRRPLPIPPLAEASNEGGTKVFDLEARKGQSEIMPGTQTDTWGYSADYLGPTIRATEGDNVRLRIKNSVDEITTVHFHGMHLPAEMDGGPHQYIEPGKTWEPEFQIRQQAATLWYHPHPHGESARHTYRGLAGLFIIDDDNPAAAELPHEYGVDDIPLVLQDKRFNSNGSLDERDLPDVGLLGDTAMVNGITDPEFRAETGRVRFRILDGSIMRLYNLKFSDDRPFQVIASDGGLLGEPREVTSLILSPGERAEIIVDFQQGDDVMLQAAPFPENFFQGNWDIDDAPNFGLGDSFDLLHVTGPQSGATPAAAALPASLNPTAVEQLDVQGAPTRDFQMSWFQINGRQMNMSRIDDTIDHDGWEVWTVKNNDNWIHNFHVHDTQFRVVGFDGDQGVMKDGWKDTVMLVPGAEAKIAVRFTDYTSNRWPYMYHCHLLYHEDQGMMGQFLVINPGEEPDPAIGEDLPRGYHDHRQSESSQWAQYQTRTTEDARRGSFGSDRDSSRWLDQDNDGNVDGSDRFDTDRDNDRDNDRDWDLDIG